MFKNNAGEGQLYRPAAIEVAGHRLEAEDEIAFLGLSAATGGDPEVNARMAAGWRAFHANKVHLTTRKLPKHLRWKRWKVVVAPELTYGC